MTAPTEPAHGLFGPGIFGTGIDLSALDAETAFRAGQFFAEQTMFAEFRGFERGVRWVGVLGPEQASVVAQQAAKTHHLPFDEAWCGVRILADDERVVVVQPQIFGWRIVETSPGADSAKRSWEYDALGNIVILTALEWLESDEDEPSGWKRRIRDGIPEMAEA